MSASQEHGNFSMTGGLHIIQEWQTIDIHTSLKVVDESSEVCEITTAKVRGYPE